MAAPIQIRQEQQMIGEIKRVDRTDEATAEVRERSILAEKQVLAAE